MTPPSVPSGWVVSLYDTQSGTPTFVNSGTSIGDGTYTFKAPIKVTYDTIQALQNSVTQARHEHALGADAASENLRVS